jgi:hypothetical protein
MFQPAPFLTPVLALLHAIDHAKIDPLGGMLHPLFKITRHSGLSQLLEVSINSFGKIRGGHRIAAI